MLPDARKLLDDAMKLPTSTRAELVGRLLETLEEEADEGAAEARPAESARRVTELDTGSVVTVGGGAGSSGAMNWRGEFIRRQASKA